MRYRLPQATFVIASFTSLLLSGCGSSGGTLGILTPTPIPTSNKQGIVTSGLTAVSGASIQLYAAGSAGDGTGAQPLLSQPVTSGADGSFTINGAFKCGTAGQVYLVATGGSTGNGSNPNLALMTALGSCSGLSASTFAYVNEVTTVAAVSVLAPYFSTNSAQPGSTVASGSADAAALLAAFSAAGQLTDPLRGVSPGPNVPANIYIPSAEINTLADILVPCVNSTGGVAGDSSACGSLFADATPSGGTSPTDTIAAVLDLVRNPALSTAALSALIPSSAPFLPDLTYVPPAFVIGLQNNPLIFSSPSITFTATPVGAPAATATLFVMNPTYLPVTITALTLTGANTTDFTKTTTCGTTLAAASACTVSLTFLPTATGSRGALITVTDSSAATQISLTGNGLPGQNINKYASLCTSPKVICLASIAAAMTDAKTYFATFDATYTLTIPPGTFDFSDETLLNGAAVNGAFDSSGIHPMNGLFLINGAGSANTTIISNNAVVTIFGKGISHTHYNGMTFMRDAITVSQGVVTASAPGQVTMTVPAGFPTPLDLYGANFVKYIRAYDNSNPLNPHMNVDPSNTQIQWGTSGVPAPTCTAKSNGTSSCTIYLTGTNAVLPAIYTQPNQIVCVKAEQAMQAYEFNNLGTTLGTGADVGFNDIIWYDAARGVWRDIINPFVTNSAIHRRPAINGQVECMANQSGGPQFGQPGDGAFPLTGVYVNNFESDATGDDTIAIFNDTSLTDQVINTTISNAFARTINLYNSCNIVLKNNVGNYCSPQFDYPLQYNGCITDTSPSPTPCGPNL